MNCKKLMLTLLTAFVASAAFAAESSQESANVFEKTEQMLKQAVALTPNKGAHNNVYNLFLLVDKADRSGAQKVVHCSAYPVSPYHLIFARSCIGRDTHIDQAQIEGHGVGATYHNPAPIITKNAVLLHAYGEQFKGPFTKVLFVNHPGTLDYGLLENNDILTPRGESEFHVKNYHADWFTLESVGGIGKAQTLNGISAQGLFAITPSGHEILIGFNEGFQGPTEIIMRDLSRSRVVRKKSDKWFILSEQYDYPYISEELPDSAQNRLLTIDNGKIQPIK